jgi:hypothetical protein
MSVFYDFKIMRWAGHEARMWQMRNPYKILFINLEGRDNSEDLGVNEKIILEWILGKRAWSCVLDESASG